jgi:alpha-L-fucosidase
MDYANDDDFSTSWVSNPIVKAPWYEVKLKKGQAFNAVVIAEEKVNISDYTIEYFANEKWITLFNGQNTNKIKVHRFATVKGDKVRIYVHKAANQVSIAEFQVYNEKK